MSRPTLVIGNQNYSSWSLRPWIFLKQFGVEFDCDVVPMQTSQFEAQVVQRSPNRKVPFLIDGDLIVHDSLAICEYANETWLADRAWPKDAKARAFARSVVAEMHSGFANLRNQCPMNVRRRSPGYLVSKETSAEVERILAIWREARSRFGTGGPYLFGEFGMADAFFAPVVFRIRSYGIGLDATGIKYCATMLGNPHMLAWAAAAEREPYALTRYEFAQY